MKIELGFQSGKDSILLMYYLELVSALSIWFGMAISYLRDLAKGKTDWSKTGQTVVFPLYSTNLRLQ
jgi:hypothetical protein